MTTAPVVSIIMPAHDRAEFVGAAIDGILGQSFKEFELIVVDDSNDNTPAIVKDYAQRDSRIVYRRLNRCHLPSAFNAGIAVAQGEFVTFHADDDISEVSRIEKCVNFLRQNTDMAGVMPLVGQMDKQGEGWPGYSPPPPPALLRPVPPLSDFREVLGPVGMFRTSAIREVGGFRDFFYCAEDTDFSLRWQEKFSTGFINEILYIRRNHDTNLSHNPAVGLYSTAALVSAHYRRHHKACPIEEGKSLWEVVALASAIAEDFPPQHNQRNIFRSVIKSAKGELRAGGNAQSIIHHRKKLLVQMGYARIAVIRALIKLRFLAWRLALTGRKGNL